MGKLTNGDVHNPSPCPFVVKGVGCGEYKKRPVDPCRSFKCEWITNPDLSDALRPDISMVIPITQGTPSGIKYLILVEGGQTLHAEALSWYLTYAMSNHLNFAWKVDGLLRYIGSPAFCQEMAQLYPDPAV